MACPRVPVYRLRLRVRTQQNRFHTFCLQTLHLDETLLRCNRRRLLNGVSVWTLQVSDESLRSRTEVETRFLRSLCWGVPSGHSGGKTNVCFPLFDGKEWKTPTSMVPVCERIRRSSTKAWTGTVQDCPTRKILFETIVRTVGWWVSKGVLGRDGPIGESFL